MTGPGRAGVRGAAIELLVFVAGYLAVFSTIVGAEVLAHPRSWGWGGMLHYLLPTLGGFLGGAIGRRLKSPERRRIEVAETKAMWTGTLPAGVEPGEWRWHLRRQGTSAGVTRWALLPLGVAGGALTTLAGARTSHGASGISALAAAQEVAAVALIAACLRMVRNGRRLLAQLRAES